MDVNSAGVIKKELQVHNEINDDVKCNQYAFINCRYAEQKSICISTSIKGPDWQIGFFDADGEVYFDIIEIGPDACFSSIVRNYWWNGKKGKKKREGYYSLIKSVKQLKIYNEQAVNDLADYVEGWYKAGEHWQIHGLDRNIELKIDIGLKELEETTVEQLSKYFDNIWCKWITADLKTENNIIYNCECYWFENCKRIVPQKLIINAPVEQIRFYDADNEVCIPEIVMDEKADLNSIIQNSYGNEKFSILQHVKTLVVRSNPKVLCDLVVYIDGKQEKYNNQNIYQLYNNMNIIIERAGIAFSVVKKITEYFGHVLIDDNKPEEYLAKQQSYQKSFQEHFGKYDLETDQIENFIPVSQEFELEDKKFNVGGSSRRIDELHVNQKIEQNQLVCFHDTNKPVVIDKIIIWGNGDLRCVLQNAYYNGTELGFFSLLWTTKELEIHSDHAGDNQVLVDLADYIEGKYALNTNWKQEELDKDMRINIDNGYYGLSLSVVRRLRNYFRNVSIDRIDVPLETENIIDQKCEDQYVFTNSKVVNPQKLFVNAKLAGSLSLIIFNNADSEVCIPEIMIGEHGSFNVIVYNLWRNCKKGIVYGNYSLVSHVKTLIIQKNSGAVRDLDSYVYGSYVVRNHEQEVQKLSKNTIIRINGIKGLDEQISRLKDYFGYIFVNDRKALGSQRCGAIISIQVDSDTIQEQTAANADKRDAIAQTDAEIAETKQRIERVRARLRKRRKRFQEYLALAE